MMKGEMWRLDGWIMSWQGKQCVRELPREREIHPSSVIPMLQLVMMIVCWYIQRATKQRR